MDRDVGVTPDLADHRITTVGPGWARTSVNAPIFRKDALTSDGTHQYVAFYDDDMALVVARRTLGDTRWDCTATGFAGRPRDAHNAISLIVDDSGCLHLAWDHHDSPLRYARSVSPGALAFGPEEPMLDRDEAAVTYPEFHPLPSGDLLFAYRDGESGDGTLLLNRYDAVSGTWSRAHGRLLDGEGERSAYWQLHVDAVGTVHLSWIWRESLDVATNHDIHYARSTTGGESWTDVHDHPLRTPITARNTPPIWPVAQGSNLINQTSLVADHEGTPSIATYFRAAEGGVTDIHVITFDSPSRRWTAEAVTQRTGDFSLRGVGTKSVPISRPQIVAERRRGQHWLHVLYRDDDIGEGAVLASSNRSAGTTWTSTPLPGGPLDRWEPNIDSRLWRSRGQLHVYLQQVGQLDQEGVDEQQPATDVRVLEVALPG